MVIFHGNKGTKILCDPWIENGVFDSWFHFPIKTTLNDLNKVDGIYISQFTQIILIKEIIKFDKEIPIIILNEGPNFFQQKILIDLGYTNLIEMENDQSIKFKEFNLTMFKPFVGHIYESILGNLIDSALALTNENGETIINFKIILTY